MCERAGSFKEIKSSKHKFILIANGCEDACPTLAEKRNDIKPGEKFKGVVLKEGWIIEKNEKSKETPFNWSLREDIEILNEQQGYHSKHLFFIDVKSRIQPS